MLANASILITGGTGSFGHTFVPMTLAKYDPKRLIIYSRDEMKQWEMAKLYGKDPRVRFFIGDVRDKERLYRALDGIDYVVHAAATKIVPVAEYNPFECVKTNINGAMNLVDACIDKGVKRVIALSTEKMINSVRNTVLSVLNKNNYGYISPSDFNLFAANAQMQIFEEYFDSYNKVINAENARMAGTDYADLKQPMSETIETFLRTDYLTKISDILVFAKTDPREFLNILNDPELKFQAKVRMFFENKLLVLRNNDKEIWFNTATNKRKMMSVPYGEDPYEMAGGFLQSDEGIDSLKMLEAILS